MVKVTRDRTFACCDPTSRRIGTVNFEVVWSDTMPDLAAQLFCHPRSCARIRPETLDPKRRTAKPEPGKSRPFAAWHV